MRRIEQGKMEKNMRRIEEEEKIEVEEEQIEMIEREGEGYESDQMQILDKEIENGEGRVKEEEVS